MLGTCQVCYPTNGEELVNMVNNRHDCVVLILKNGMSKPYYTTQPMVVKSPKVLIGNPINMPMIIPFPTGMSTDKLFGTFMGPERTFDGKTRTN